MKTTTLLLTGRVYTFDALQQTVDAFSGFCQANFTTVESNDFVLEVSCSQERLQDDFLNHALALSAQERLA